MDRPRLPRPTLRRNSPFTRGRVTLLLVVAGALSIFLGLVLLRSSGDLDRALAPSPEDLPISAFSPSLPQALNAFENPRFGRTAFASGLAQALASQLVSDQRGAAAAFKRTTFALLLKIRYSRDEILTHYLNRACLGSAGNTPICGFQKAADFYLGIPVENLNLGEALLLCDLAWSPKKPALLGDLSTALKTRNRLLARLRDIGRLSRAEYETEIARPLSPASDHRPIW